MHGFMLSISVATRASPPQRQGRPRPALALALLLATTLGACGQKGPLAPASAAVPAAGAASASAPAR